MRGCLFNPYFDKHFINCRRPVQPFRRGGKCCRHPGKCCRHSGIRHRGIRHWVQIPCQNHAIVSGFIFLTCAEAEGISVDSVCLRTKFFHVSEIFLPRTSINLLVLGTYFLKNSFSNHYFLTQRFKFC